MSAHAAQLATDAYLAETVKSARREELPLLLFDGALRFLGRAQALAAQGSAEAFGHQIARAQAVVDELNVSLDLEQGGEIARNLRDIYVFVNGHLASALVARDARKVGEAAGLLRELRDGYEHALRSRG
ncbi:fliS: flagellar protein FliS [Gaiella occulta]|uniref:Flagellar secretion chaperone FliS n=1 Tax=Gaiella occulta TaxID=1002870 RepID=A0A7M2Z0Q0_9ACTN|nr:flagellar export chaperone FliS [Gaiella occulta]RDI76006.1 fliS: flagellar protein FliS [Gaiella occulta]